ncbi:MAG: hypothetical protein NZ700_04430, partial [Gemmataceae bacterium]|nr:hypothetical protein [Gemmataceae bacterium]
MRSNARIVLWGALAWGWAGSAAAAADPEPTYWQDVRPILRRHCTVCHNQKRLDEVEVSGGLALDSLEAIRRGSKRPVLTPGKGAESLFIQVLLTKDENKRMPLAAPPLEPETIDLLRRWIDTGAKEGTRPADQPGSTPTERRPTRKLDVVLPTTTTPPAGVFGPAKPARLDLALKIGPLSPVTAVAFGPDGQLLATGTYGQVTLWNLHQGRPVKFLTNVLGAVNDVKFSPDGQRLAVAGGQPSAKGDLRLYQVGEWKLLGSLGGHADVVSGIAFSTDGKYLASASFDKTVRVWEVASQRLLQTLTGHSDFAYAVAFSPDGQWLVSASKDRSVKMVDWASGKSRLTFSGFDDDVLAVAVTGDGKQVVASGHQPALAWYNAQTGERLRAQTGHGANVHELAFSRDGKLLVSASSDRTVRIWDGTNGSSVRTLQVGAIAYSAAISPDASRIAVGSFDGLVRLYETGTGRHLLTLVSLPENSWLALTPEGYADGSEGLLALAQWRMAQTPLAAEAVW